MTNNPSQTNLLIMDPFSREKHISKLMQLDFQEHHCNVNKQSQLDAYIDANTIDLDQETPIYRIFHWDRFLQSIHDGKLCLVKPSLWDDPFENFLLSCDAITKEGEPVSLEPMKEQVYGMCWTLDAESDGLWRNYTNYSCKSCIKQEDHHKRSGKRNVSVKVKTTVGKLMHCLYDIENQFHSLCYWIGKVDYVSESKIEDIIGNGISTITDGTCVGLMSSLLIKRPAFSYEQEVRLLFYRPPNLPEKGYSNVRNKWDNVTDKFFISFNPDELFDEVELDPWVKDEDIEKLKKEISRDYNGSIKRSELYKKRTFQIQMD